MNIELAVKILVFLWIVNGFFKILSGMVGIEKSTTYGKADIVDGFVAIILALLIMLL